MPLNTSQNSLKKKKMITPNTVEDVTKLDHSYIGSGNVKQYSHPGKYYGSFLQK